MTTTSAAAAALAASRTSLPDASARATSLIRAARLLLPALERGRPIDAAVLRAAMEHAVGASDSDGGWDWKSAYDACEAAAVLFLRKFGGAMAARAGSAAALLPMLARMARLLPSHTRRSIEGDELQQFSTPVALALVASTAAAIIPSDHVLEPSAGTGLLAIFAELAGASLVLNERAETRAGLLDHLFPDVGLTRFDAARINAQAKAAARSAFESAKQRFFNHLITAMKTPTLIKSIERDLEAGHAAVVQLVSTGEALMERRLAEIPTEEWGDVSVDITPREYVLDYLAHSFPTQLFEEYTDSDGNLASRPVFHDGVPVQCRETVERRDRLIEHLAALDPVPGALDQIVQHFGSDNVAEVTGRSRRIVAKVDGAGDRRLAVESRAGSANLAETQAFQDDEKRILVFSDAGGTGRSYHADLGARNQRRRVHYLLEAGWKADAAIQGLGRTNRTNQAQPPLFRPIATDVKAEKRFLSTIARRLDSLGAITKGQRQTGGQGLFRPEDNLESVYARAALRQLYTLLYAGKVEGCSLQRFVDATGFTLTDRDGSLKQELPPISQFLNRLLALTIDLQNTLFETFEALLQARIEGAIASGTYDVGVETITAASLRIVERRTIYTHPGTGATTQVFTIVRRDRNEPLSLADALEQGAKRGCRLLLNARSHRAAVQAPAPSLMLDDGAIERRVRLVRPLERPSIAVDALAATAWQEADPETFALAWEAELAQLPEFRESTLHVVTGLLLPIWRKLPNDGGGVYRLQTDGACPGAGQGPASGGERVIGRQVSPAWVAAACATVPELSSADAFADLMSGRMILHLADGLQLRRVRIMHAHRIELIGFTDAMRERLTAYGLFHEIIAWKLRMFVPTDARSAEVLGKLMERYPLQRIAEREGA